MTLRFQAFRAQSISWLTLAMLCAACGPADDDASAGTGATAGVGATAGAGAMAGMGGVAGGGAGGVGGDDCIDCKTYECDEGSWHEDVWHPCQLWSECGTDEVPLNVPDEYTDRVCARVEFVDQFGTADRDDATSVAANPDGTLCVAGKRYDSPKASAKPVGGFTRKYAADGALVWASEFSGDGAEVTDVAISSAGDCYSLGLTNQPDAAAGEWFVRKHGTDGSAEWSATGSSEAHAPQQLETDPSGNVFASFLTRSPLAFSAPHQAELMKFDATGALSWSTAVGSTGQDNAFLALIADEAVVVRSTPFEPADYDPDATTVHATRLTTDGAVSWERGYPSSEINNVVDVVGTPDGNVIVAGFDTAQSATSRSIAYTLDPSGNGTSIELGDWSLRMLRVGADGLLWTQERDTLSKWTSSGDLLDWLELGYTVFVRDFEPIPGYLVLVGYPHQLLAGQTELGGGDAFLLKLRID
ncbi:MAG: hypothetical protein H6718_29740 [Polyangiaceae bacterium]|nr:hypothetical protein [Polyangiaceae bacterium]